MKQRVGMEDDDEDDDEEEKQKAVWGRGKKIYYGADNVNYEVQLCFSTSKSGSVSLTTP